MHKQDKVQWAFKNNLKLLEKVTFSVWVCHVFLRILLMWKVKTLKFSRKINDLGYVLGGGRKKELVISVM